MGENMNTNRSKYRIAITTTSEQDLWALERAFLNDVEHGEHQEASDDFLIAVLLGWHMRRVEYDHPQFIKEIYTEFAFRRGIAGGAEGHDDLHSRRLANRGTPSTPGNVLSIDGIDDKTLGRIEVRVHSLKRMVEKLKEPPVNDFFEAHHQKVMKTLAGYSDQAILDFCIWATLMTCNQLPTSPEQFPHEYRDEIMARGQARLEYNLGLLSDDNDGELPSLSPRDRRAFFIKRRIRPTSQFWTDDRIRAAMEMGL